MSDHDKVNRESVDEVLEIVGTYGPWGPDINESLRFQIVLAEEVKALRGMKANLSQQSIVEWASSWVPESNRARFADALKAELNNGPSTGKPRTSVPEASEGARPVAWMEYDRDGRAIGPTMFKPDGFWPFEPLYLATKKREAA